MFNLIRSLFTAMILFFTLPTTPALAEDDPEDWLAGKFCNENTCFQAMNIRSGPQSFYMYYQFTDHDDADPYAQINDLTAMVEGHEASVGGMEFILAPDGKSVTVQLSKDMKLLEEQAGAEKLVGIYSLKAE